MTAPGSNTVKDDRVPTAQGRIGPSERVEYTNSLQDLCRDAALLLDISLNLGHMVHALAINVEEGPQERGNRL